MDNAKNTKSSGDLPLDQIERFKRAARELGCDEDEAAFKDKLRMIARQKPKDEPKQPKKSK